MKKFVSILTAVLFSVSVAGFAETITINGQKIDPDKTICGSMDVFDGDDDDGIEDEFDCITCPTEYIDWTIECSNDTSPFDSVTVIGDLELFAEGYEPKEIETEPKKANEAIKKAKSTKKKQAIVDKLNKKYSSSLTTYAKKLQSSFKEIWAKATKKNSKLKKLKVKKVTVKVNPEAKFELEKPKATINKQDWHKKRTTLKDIFAWDSEVWANTLFPVDSKYKSKKQAEIRKVLLRVFALLHESGMMYRPNEKAGWYNYPHPTSSIISHGGRVLVAVKKSANLSKRAITNWIFTGKASGDKQKTNKTIHFKKRFASTHRTIFEKNRVEEEKLSIGKGLKKLSFKKATNLSNNYAFNVPLGGYGNEGGDGSAIRANGRFAHLLVILNDAPKKNKIWQTAFQIGVEHSEPIFFTKPYAPKGHLGTSHGLGGSESMSIMNTKKFKELANKFKTVPANYNCMRIEIDSKDDLVAAQKLAKKLMSKSKKDILKFLNSKPQAKLKDEGMVEIDLD